LLSGQKETTPKTTTNICRAAEKIMLRKKAKKQQSS